MKENDNINHPKHYSGSCSLEAIEGMFITFGGDAVYCFCLCNAYKYLWRYQNKNGTEDLKKAKWYLDYCEKIIYQFEDSLTASTEDLYNQKDRLEMLINKKIENKEGE